MAATMAKLPLPSLETDMTTMIWQILKKDNSMAPASDTMCTLLYSLLPGSEELVAMQMGMQVFPGRMWTGLLPGTTKMKQEEPVKQEQPVKQEEEEECKAPTLTREDIVHSVIAVEEGVGSCGTFSPLQQCRLIAAELRFLLGVFHLEPQYIHAVNWTSIMFMLECYARQGARAGIITTEYTATVQMLLNSMASMLPAPPSTLAFLVCKAALASGDPTIALGMEPYFFPDRVDHALAMWNGLWPVVKAEQPTLKKDTFHDLFHPTLHVRGTANDA